MNESDKFQIELLTNFERTLQKLIRDRYRKNPQGKAEFVALIEKFIKILSIEPRPRPPLGHLEQWPKGTSRDGWELWKLEFKMPQISSGEAGQGRLIYLINCIEKKVGFIWIYTHAEAESATLVPKTHQPKDSLGHHDRLFHRMPIVRFYETLSQVLKEASYQRSLQLGS